GSSFTVTVNAVDANWNAITNAGDTIAVTCSDTNALLPSNAALLAGTQVFSVTFKTSGARTITASDSSDGTKTANLSSSLTVNPATFVKLQLLVPGETAAAGTVTGKTGAPASQTAGTAFNVTVNAVDDNWNIVTTITDGAAI